MRQIELEELRTIQLDILSNLDVFCRENGIKYSIADGTFLGAVRHKGYIPWDDDIDVYLLRTDYQKFISLFPSVYNSHYRLASLETNPKWTRAYSNMYDDRTILIENSKGLNIGVNVDIFPIDDVPDSEYTLNAYFKKLKLLSNIHAIKTIRWRRGRSLSKNLFMLASQVLLCCIPLRKIAERMDVYSQKCNGEGYSRVYESCFGVSGQKPFPKSLFDNFDEYDFEDRKVLGLKDYDTFLKQAYGDYMQLPPIEKRITHHGFTAYWKD